MVSTSRWARHVCFGVALLSLLAFSTPRPAAADSVTDAVVTDTWRDVVRGIACGLSIGASIVSGGYFLPGTIAVCLVGMFQTMDG